MIYIFDTDHLSLYQRQDSVVLERVRHVDYDIHELATTVINCQEQISGRFEQVQRAKSSVALVEAYKALKTTVEFFEDWPIFAYADRAERQFQSARKSGIRIGTLDLRIATICIANDATLVTRNRKDFQQVPSLMFEDWSVRVDLGEDESAGFG